MDGSCGDGEGWLDHFPKGVKIKHTPPKTNMEPEKGPLEKDENLQTTNF